MDIEDAITVTVTVTLQTGGNPSMEQVAEFVEESKAWGALEPDASSYVQQLTERDTDYPVLTSTFPVRRQRATRA